jgi:hypothetical protein
VAIQKARTIIHEVLTKHKAGEVQVEFLQGRYRRYLSDLTSEETEPRREVDEAGSGEFHRDIIRLGSMPGQSLALHVNGSTSGTLGGFFELKFAGSNQTKVMGLTCFHVVEPDDTSPINVGTDTIEHWRQYGIKPGDNMARELKVDHPSPRAIQETTRALEKEIDKIQTSDFKLNEEPLSHDIEIKKGTKKRHLQAKRQLSDWKAFLNDIQTFDPGFGSVWATSGLKVGRAPSIDGGNHALPTIYDWALIEIPSNRVGSNTVSLTMYRNIYYTLSNCAIDPRGPQTKARPSA